MEHVDDYDRRRLSLRPYVNQFIAENRTRHHLELSVRDWQLLDDTRQF